MGFGIVLGGAMVCYSIGRAAYEMIYNTPENQFKKILAASFTTHTGLPQDEGIEVLSIKTRDYGFEAEIRLPSGLTVCDFRKHIPGIEEDTYSEILFHHKRGRHCNLKFGRHSLDDFISYDNAPKDQLGIPLMTAFGWKFIDLTDESSCHMLGGGATRMGKTVFIRLLIAHTFTYLKGNCHIVIASAKDSDYYMFRKIPGITVADRDSTLLELKRIIVEMERRKDVIDMKGNVNDARSLAKRYPKEAFPPIYVLIDEVGAYSDDEEVENILIELAERAGYLDIHLVIFAQRPDATQVLNGRVRANLLVNIAFTTRDEANSKMIIGSEHAAHLGRIQGRAILIDGMMHTVQVPYMSNDMAEELLNPYTRSVENDEQGQIDSSIAETLPCFVTGSTREIDLPRSNQSCGNDQQDHETIKQGSMGNTNRKTKR